MQKFNDRYGSLDFRLIRLVLIVDCFGVTRRPIQKLMLTLLVFLMVSILPAQSDSINKVSFSLRAGINVFQIFGTSSQAFNHFGFSGGPKLGYRFESRWSFDPEIQYNMRGAARNPNVDKGDYYSFSVDLDYIDIPLLFNYYFGKKRSFSFESGPYIGFLVRQKAYENGSPINTTNTGFNIYDIGVSVGFNYYLPKGFSLNLRYTNSIVPIQPLSGTVPWGVASFNLGPLNSGFSFALVYKFNFAKKQISETGASSNRPIKEKKKKKQKGDVIDEDE